MGTGAHLTSDEAKALRDNLKNALNECQAMPGRFKSPIHDFFPELHVDRPREACVFIGHGRSKLWARLQLFLQNDLGLKTITYESVSRVGESIVPVLESMLRQATFAVLVLTTEDETAEGGKRARQNVVHEAGLFQGQLGFPRAILLQQSGLEDFSNVAGLQYIGFEGENIETTFWELQRVLKREGLAY
jgi:predicted nucleotide-binding protein